ncbi:ester cyclase [[Actinomadura] parvosata]|uniref:ester cyclase n=1 Tax=[Actinomadura] parvosata TaxID=1955412 RepID=UPI00406CE6C1
MEPDQVAIVTGASGGIGHVTAEGLADAGLAAASFGVPATGREFQVRIHEFHELARGRIVRTWQLEDWLAWFRQVDASPAH